MTSICENCVKEDYCWKKQTEMCYCKDFIFLDRLDEEILFPGVMDPG